MNFFMNYCLSKQISEQPNRCNKNEKVNNFSNVMKKKFLPSSRWWFKFLFFFLQEFCFKNTLFNDGTENDFFFFLSNVCMNFPWNFLFVFFFSKQKSDFFFLCYREFWPLCSGVVFFFSGPLVRLLCSHNLRPSKRPQSLEKLSDFPITLIHFIYNFWENLANLTNKRIRRFDFTSFFFFFL